MDDWFDRSSYLVLLQVPDEAALADWAARLDTVAAVTSRWREPDRGSELCSIAVAPSPAVERLLANLPLLLREPAMT